EKSSEHAGRSRPPNPPTTPESTRTLRELCKQAIVRRGAATPEVWAASRSPAAEPDGSSCDPTPCNGACTVGWADVGHCGVGKWGVNGAAFVHTEEVAGSNHATPTRGNPQASGHPLCLVADLVARLPNPRAAGGQQTGLGVAEGLERSLAFCLNRLDRSIGALIRAISSSGPWPSFCFRSDLPLVLVSHPASPTPPSCGCPTRRRARCPRRSWWPARGCPPRPAWTML